MLRASVAQVGSIFQLGLLVGARRLVFNRHFGQLGSVGAVNHNRVLRKQTVATQASKDQTTHLVDNPDSRLNSWWDGQYGDRDLIERE